MDAEEQRAGGGMMDEKKTAPVAGAEPVVEVMHMEEKKTAPVAGAEESLRDLYKQMATIKTPKECRKLHKKLKRYGRGMFFTDRHPDFPIWVAGAAVVVSVVVLILQMFGIGN